MTASPCPSEAALDRAHAVGADPVVVEHVARCEACRTFWDEMTSVVELARELPVDVPSASHRESIRTAVLAGAAVRPEPRARRVAWKVPAFAIAVAAAVTLVAVREPRPTPPAASAPVTGIHAHRGVVHAHAGAQYALTTSSPDEIVRLREGTIDVDVDPLQPGERFRVIVGTDEVEVRGTSFEVVAVADRIRSVHAVHGRVEVRHAGTRVAVLTAGQGWTANRVVVEVPPPSSAPATLPPPAVVRRPERWAPPAQQANVEELAPVSVPGPRDPQEAAFVTGWDAMRRSEYQRAAAAFARTVALEPHGSLAEDGAFWYAVALARVPRLADATAAFHGFLAEFPTSTRAGEAAAMLGWLLVASAPQEARQLFEAALHDPSASVQHSARQGLDALVARSR
ncbi:hypothetical protein BH11MYX3_BH11MYX3_39560 [soil metagenome]